MGSAEVLVPVSRALFASGLEKRKLMFWGFKGFSGLVFNEHRAQNNDLGKTSERHNDVIDVITQKS